MLTQRCKLPVEAYFCSPCVYKCLLHTKSKRLPSVLTHAVALVLTSALFMFGFPPKSPVTVESQLPSIHPKSGLMHRSGKKVPSQKGVRHWTLGGAGVPVPVVLVLACL